MKIAKTEVFVLADPPPSGPVDAPISELAFVRIQTDEGIDGLSEIFGVPAGVAKAVLHGPDSFLGRQLIREDPSSPERLWTKLYNSMLHGNRRGWAIICIGAAEIALWDICGKMLGRPVYELLGGAERAEDQVYRHGQHLEVVPYATIVSTDWDQESVLREQTKKVVKLCELGFRAVKVEPVRSAPETIIELARRARKELGPDRILCVDVGYIWNDVGIAVQVARRLEEFDVFFLETPFPVDALEAYARLTAKSNLRIAAGEHSTTRWEFIDLMDRARLQVVQPWMTTVGGLSEAKRVVDLALRRGVIVCPGNWSTQVLGSASVHFAAVSPISPIIEFPPAAVHWSPLRKAIEEAGMPLIDGAIHLPTKPGIGIELSSHLIDHFRVA